MVEADKKHLLVVEGQDDKHVIRHIQDQCSQNLEFAIKESEGFPNILRYIGPETKVAGRKSVGFVMDSNDCPKQRWNDVRKKLTEAGFTPPNSPDPHGTIIDGDRVPAVGVWLMPDNSSRGEIEDFVIKMIGDHDPVWPLAQSYINSIPDDARKFSSAKSDKAKLYAWLATRKKPNRMGAAVSAGDLIAQTQLNSLFVDWLSKLFGQAERTDSACIIR